MKTRASILSFVFCCLTLLSATASASTVNFAGTFNVSYRNHDPGLVVNVSPSTNAPLNFNLDNTVGSSVTFGLFDIWTDESFVNADDKVAYPISVGFSFASPSTGGGSINGTTVGNSVLRGLFQWGSVNWSAPTSIQLDNGMVILASLSDEVFNKGLFGLLNCFGANVKATFEVRTPGRIDPPPVPVPAALPLLASGLGALGFIGWRKKRKADAATA